jgi:Ca2+-binding EF-hand superfamily protein
LRKDIYIVINQKFKSLEEAFIHCDKVKYGCLNRDEIKALLKDNGVSTLLRGVVAGEMIKGYEKCGKDAIYKDEFKVAIAELGREY